MACQCGNHHDHECGCEHHHDHNCGCDHHHDHEHGCGCGHSHGSGKAVLWRMGAAAVLLVAAILLPLEGPWKLFAFLVPYLIVGADVLLSAGRNILRGRVFDEAFLMALATVGALCLGEYAEAVLVLLFYQLGEWFEHLAQRRSRASIAALMDLRPDTATLEGENGPMTVDPASVPVGSVILVKPGEKVPLDGTVLSGQTALDTAALTGESLPREAGPGDAVLSGCVNLTGLIRVKVEKEYAASTAARILELVENAAAGKSKSETFLRRFARWYTPAVVLGAVVLAVLPSLITGQWSVWIRRALTFLVVSCPCALVVSVPLTFFAGIGAASRRGILIKGSGYLEALSRAGTVVFDKTGTLTEGRLQVTALQPDRQDLLEYAALAEHYSDHPAARALRMAWDGTVGEDRIAETEELPGCGVRTVVDGNTVLCGNARLMERFGLPAPEAEGTAVYVAVNGELLGTVLLSDTVKPDAAASVAKLRDLGLTETVMLTGDRLETAQRVGEETGVDTVYAQLLPDGKVEKLRELLDPTGKRPVIYVGDGINDAPVLALADVGVAMGAFGSDAAMEAADVVLMEDRLSALAEAVELARRTGVIVGQNIVFSLGVKALFLLLGALGLTGLGWAVFADVGVLMLAVLNAMRAGNLNGRR